MVQRLFTDGQLMEGQNVEMIPDVNVAVLGSPSCYHGFSRVIIFTIQLPKSITTCR